MAEPSYCDVPLRHRLTAHRILLLASFLLASLGGCSTHWITPGAGSDLARLGTANLAVAFGRKPTALFPSFMTVVRIQAPGYGGAGGSRRFVVLEPEDDDVARDEDLRTMAGWEEIGRVERMHAGGLSEDIDSLDALRATLDDDTDLLFVHSMDTRLDRLDDHEDALPAGAPFSFGPLSAAELEIAATASALIVDVRTGFVYGFSRFTSRRASSTRSWKNVEALEAARREIEREAFEGVLRASRRKWERAIMHYAGGRRVPR
jgi:hypothetical protein